MSCRLLIWLVCVPLLGAALSARADEPALRATVLHIDGEDVVIDVGAAQLTTATELTVYRPLEVRHPITGKRVRDRFAIGVLRVVQPGERLSIAHAVNKPRHAFAVGDIVESASAAPAPAPAPQPAPASKGVITVTPAPAAPASATVAAATTAVPAPHLPTAASDRVLVLHWRATLNQSPEQRVRIYLAYLTQHPGTPYHAALVQEINYLREIDARLRTRASVHAASAAITHAPAESSLIEMAPRTRAEAGRDVELAALLRVPNVRAVLLHVRALESPGYHTQTMVVDARGHARARVSKDLVRAPGLAYFVELVGEDGKNHAALGSASEPRIAVVQGASPAAAQRERAVRVKASSELVSFDGTSGRDYFFISEGDFLYRVRRGALYGLRIGYGTLRGEGGTVEQLDVQMQESQPAGFSYGFVEAELELHRLFGLATRGTIGLGRPDDPSAQRNGLTGGFQLRARIGEAEGTHLVLAGEVMPEIGQRAYLGLAWEAIEDVPMATEIVVTDQPVNSDELAVRLIYELGYRFTDRITVALRPSYQLRTIRHAGPGIGMAATFDW
jgi:hypothetical protein